MFTLPAPHYRPLLWFAALLLLVVLAEHAVTTRADFALRPVLPAAVTFDLLIGLPLLFYLLVVRRYRLPLTSVVGAFGGAVALGYWLIPAGQQTYLGWARHSLVLLEAGTFTLALIRLRRLVRVYREAARHRADFLANLHEAFHTVLGKVAGPLVSEVALVRYALFSARARPEVEARETAFSAARESGFSALMIALAGMSVVETAAVHLLLSRWSAPAAWVALVLDAYTLLFVLAHRRAVMLRPVVLDAAAGHLTVRVGFLWQLHVPLSALAAVEELTGDAPAADATTLNLAKPLLTPPNLRIVFTEPVCARGLYGLRRQPGAILLYLDDRAAFRQLVAAAVSAQNG